MTDEAEIYRRMRLFGYSLANRMLPEQERDDAVQTAMLGVCKAIPRLRPGSNWEPFMVRVVRQELGMYAREHYSRREEARGGTLEPPQPVPGQSDQPRISGRLRAVLDTLPERHREAMVECVAEGRTKQRAAEVIGCSDVSVGNYIKRALPVLREAMVA